MKFGETNKRVLNILLYLNTRIQLTNSANYTKALHSKFLTLCITFNSIRNN